MNAGAMVRMVRLSWIVLLAVLAVGVLSVHEAEAKPNNGTNKESISTRAKDFEEDCEALGGEVVEANYGYDSDGNLESANLKCSGGELDRVNCTYTVDKSTCYTQPKHITPGTTTTPSNGLPAGNSVAEDPETAVDPRLVWAGVGSAGVAEDETEP